MKFKLIALGLLFHAFTLCMSFEQQNIDQKRSIESYFKNFINYFDIDGFEKSKPIKRIASRYICMWKICGMFFFLLENLVLVTKS